MPETSDTSIATLDGEATASSGADRLHVAGRLMERFELPPLLLTEIADVAVNAMDERRAR